MKIGLVIEHFDPRRGGVEQWTAQFAAALAARGHEVHVAAASFSAGTAAMPIVAHRVGEFRSRVGFARAAEEMLRTLELDVVHDTGCGWHCDVFQPHGGSRRTAAERNIFLAPSWQRPLKRAVNAVSPRYRQFEALMRKQYVADGRIFIALSRRVAADLANIHGVQQDDVRLVYNGVDTKRFSPQRRAEFRDRLRKHLGVAPQTLMLLLVAHNFRLKGVPMLLEAMSRWQHSRAAHLVVVGGKRLTRYRRAACRLSAAATFVGSVEDPAPFYAAADVYVHPTFYDPCSLVALEALAAGLPVVTSRENGVAELIAHGREGFLLDDPRDCREFLASLAPLLDDRRREEMGRRARETALLHSFDRNVDEIIAIYEEIIKRRRESALPHVPFVVRRTGEAKRGLDFAETTRQRDNADIRPAAGQRAASPFKSGANR